MEFSVGKAVLDYNVGYEKGSVLPHLGLPLTHVNVSAQKIRDRKREQLVAKKMKKNLKGNLGSLKGEYEPGAF